MQIPGASSSERSLPEILDTLGRIAALYRDQALAFTCVEEITVTRYRTRRIVGRESHRFDYFYVFEEPAAEPTASLTAGLQDYRADIADRGTEPERIDLMERGIPAAISRAYSWIFVFQPSLRSYFTFTREPDGEALGRPAWVVSFTPDAPYFDDFNDWFGRVWIDRENYQLLRAVAAKSPDWVRSHDPRNSSLPATADSRIVGGNNPLAGTDLGAAAPATELLFAWTEAEFAEERNGLRFPTESRIVAAWIDIGRDDDESYRAATRELLERGVRLDPVFRVVQSYDDYRFFQVHTSSEVDQAIRGIPPR